MYPATFFGLFPPFPLTNRAFVAMSFDTRFDSRWNGVLQPAIRNVTVNDEALEPYRLDLSKRGDSMLTEILDEIARARVIVADITTLSVINGYVVRNQNVFYEFALAHAARLPEEVLLFRSDDDPLAFDISNVRVHSYEPDSDPDAAKQFVVSTIGDSLRELKLRRQIAIRRTAESLDARTLVLLMEAQEGIICDPKITTMGEVVTLASRVDAISRLLEVGALKATYTKVTPGNLTNETLVRELIHYESTAFGKALLDYVLSEMGAFDPAIFEHLRKLAEP